MTMPALPDRPLVVAALLSHTGRRHAVTDSHGRLLWCNDGFAQCCRLAAAQLHGRLLDELLEQTGLAQRLLTDPRQGAQLRAPAGPAGLLGLTASLVADGSASPQLALSLHELAATHADTRPPPSVDAAMARSVQDALMALRVLKQRLDLATQEIGFGTWEIDSEHPTEQWSDTMFALRGWRVSKKPLAPTERLTGIHADDLAAVKTVFDAARASTEPMRVEFRQRMPDGGYRWLSSVSIPIADESTDAFKRIGVDWDITDSKLAQTAMREGEIAKAANSTKTQFLARMSHELRTPLNAVLGFAQLLLQDGDASDAATREARLAHIRSAGQHLLTLINDVLDVSGFERGDHRLSLGVVDLAELVPTAIGVIDALARQHRVQLHVGAMDQCVIADAARLRQVLVNLLTNAIKFNREEGEVHLDVTTHDGQILLQVRDTGRGMKAEQLRLLFEPFGRLSGQSDSAGGMGIGLTIAKTLIERMNGSINVRSTEHVGTTVTVHLPAAAATAATRNSSIAPALPQADRGSVLYIEDNAVNVLIVEELLTRRPGLSVHHAADGVSGVALAQSLKPDLILLDMQLPDFDGYEVIRRLRADPATADTACMALSANAMPIDIDAALAAGCVSYLTKPLDFDHFLAEIDRHFAPDR